MVTNSLNCEGNPFALPRRITLAVHSRMDNGGLFATRR
jgi:hypothetical protein